MAKRQGNRLAALQIPKLAKRPGLHCDGFGLVFGFARRALPLEVRTLGTRARLRERRLTVLRSEGRWDDVLREDSADEEAHRALMREHAAGGDRPAAARQFRLLGDELAQLGAEPSEETLALHASSRVARRFTRPGSSTPPSKGASASWYRRTPRCSVPRPPTAAR